MRIPAWLGAAVAQVVASWPLLAMSAAGPAAFSGGVAPPEPNVRARPAPSPTGSTAFHETVLPHLDAAYNLARFLTRDADAADDIVQDAFLRAFRAFDGFRGGDARAWLLTIVRNCVRNWAGERNRARAFCEPLGTAPQTESAADAEARESEVWDPDQDTPESTLLRDSEASLIRRLIEALPEAFREVLILREFDGLSYKQIADITATPIGTVMSRLARARQMLGDAWRGRSGESRP
jgi:RNA polymerase sigma-70 factor (ECF subfamily)